MLLNLPDYDQFNPIKESSSSAINEATGYSMGFFSKEINKRKASIAELAEERKDLIKAFMKAEDANTNAQNNLAEAEREEAELRLEYESLFSSRFQDDNGVVDASHDGSSDPEIRQLSKKIDSMTNRNFKLAAKAKSTAINLQTSIEALRHNSEMASQLTSEIEDLNSKWKMAAIGR